MFSQETSTYKVNVHEVTSLILEFHLETFFHSNLIENLKNQT